jgi:universal stress protein A
MKAKKGLADNGTIIELHSESGPPAVCRQRLDQGGQAGRHRAGAELERNTVMKIRPTANQGGVVVELGPHERAIPGAVSYLREAAPFVFKLRNILVPIDFSPCSKKALQYAVPFARQFGATLHLLYVGQSYYMIPEFAPAALEPAEVQARSDAIAKLTALAEEEIAREVPAEILVRKGQPAEEVVLAAKEIGADLIIISTHGYTGLKHVWLGSTTESVVRHAACPVLVVRQQEREFVKETE